MRKNIIAVAFLCYVATVGIASDSGNLTERPPLSWNAQTLSPQDRLDQYMKSRFILHINNQYAIPAIKSGIQDYIKATGKWPNDLSVKEQFYLNADFFDMFEVQNIFSSSKKLNWNDFKTFAQPYNDLRGILVIYLAFHLDEERSEFIKFCNPYLEGFDEFNRFYGMKKSEIMHWLLPVFQAFPNKEERSEFIKFCNPYLTVCSRINQSLFMKLLLPLFKIILSDQNFAITFQKFNKYMDRYYSIKNNNTIISFLPRTYLCEIRTFSSLEAENNPPTNETMQVIADLDEKLPVVWKEDPFISKARETQPFVDAHEFDSIYPDELELLKSQTDGYKDDICSKAYTRYNNDEVKRDFHTNTEVEDFIQYLDAEFLSDSSFIKIDGTNYNTNQIVSLVKQMLGIEPNATNVRGLFYPYLGSSIFFEESNSSKGDEMLGRIWYLVKKLGQEEIDKKNESGDEHEIEKAISNAKDLKRSVVIAVLEAAEINQEGATTHCQTRITGELLKAICLHLKGSKLRGLIMSENIQTNDEEEAEIIAHIEAAPQKAQQLFKAIHKEDTGAIRTLREKHILAGTEPELFEIYLAYYDDLYQRTVISDVDGKREYKKDEHILMRDDHGNLVSCYNADGSMRQTPHIVYYQSEFQVLEHAFTQLMLQEFEEQRGIKY